MSEKELKRRDLTGMTSSESILAAVSSLHIGESRDYIHPTDMLGLSQTLQEFKVEVTSPNFKVPSTICMPLTDSKVEGNIPFIPSVCIVKYIILRL